MSMKFSVQENLVPGDRFEEKLAHLERIGFQGVELWGSSELGQTLDRITDATSTSSIRVSTICAGYPGSLISPERDERKAAMEGIRERLRWSSKLGAVGVITVPGFGEAKVPDLSPLYKDRFELEWKLLVEELKALGKEADEIGAFIIIEPLNRYETHFIKTLAQASSVCNEVGHEKVKMMADYFHMSIEESDIGRSLSQFMFQIVHVHLADSNRMTPGRGHTDFGTLKLLRDGGYKHYLALECGVPGDPFDELKRTLSYLKSF